MNARVDQRIDQRILVPFDFPVIFTDHVFDRENAVLRVVLDRLKDGNSTRALFYIDANADVPPRNLANEIGTWCKAWDLDLAAPPRIIAGGESLKNDWPQVQQFASEMLALRMDRHSTVVIVGGGAALDAVGFAASLVHRGLRVIRIPTTALAQCDGAVGVKTGINFGGAKNALGTFAPPFGVIDDFQFLLTLPASEWRGGAAEAFKVAIIRDAPFLDFLCANAEKIRARDPGPMRHLIQRCAELHLDHIRAGGDPFEMGRSRPLDFGHWAAHKLELLSAFAIGHGDAVAAGIALDSAYATIQGWISEPYLQRIHTGLAQCGFPLWYTEMENPALLDGLREFQEHLGGELCVTFPDGIGNRREESRIDLDTVRKALALLRERVPA